MRTALTIILFCFSLSALAQNSGTIKGTLSDSTGRQSLKDASITLLDPSDSTVEHYTLAKTDGSFELSGVPFGTYLAHISFQGYEPVSGRSHCLKPVRCSASGMYL